MFGWGLTLEGAGQEEKVEAWQEVVALVKAHTDAPIDDNNPVAFLTAGWAWVQQKQAACALALGSHNPRSHTWQEQREHRAEWDVAVAPASNAHAVYMAAAVVARYYNSSVNTKDLSAAIKAVRAAFPNENE